MKIDTKLKAFTILEVTISMIIAAISIGIAYTAYTIMKQSYRKYDERNKMIAEVVLADKLLKKDFSDAKQITKGENGLVLKTTAGLITYTLNDQQFLRNQYDIRIDTFHLPVQNCKFYYVEDLKSTELVKRINMETTVDGNLMNFSHEKKYSAEDLVDEQNKE